MDRTKLARELYQATGCKNDSPPPEYLWAADRALSLFEDETAVLRKRTRDAETALAVARENIATLQAAAEKMEKKNNAYNPVRDAIYRMAKNVLQNTDDPELASRIDSMEFEPPESSVHLNRTYERLVEMASAKAAPAEVASTEERNKSSEVEAPNSFPDAADNGLRVVEIVDPMGRVSYRRHVEDSQVADTALQIILGKIGYSLRWADTEEVFCSPTTPKMLVRPEPEVLCGDLLQPVTEEECRALLWRKDGPSRDAADEVLTYRRDNAPRVTVEELVGLLRKHLDGVSAFDEDAIKAILARLGRSVVVQWEVVPSREEAPGDQMTDEELARDLAGENGRHLGILHPQKMARRARELFRPGSVAPTHESNSPTPVPPQAQPNDKQDWVPPEVMKNAADEFNNRLSLQYAAMDDIRKQLSAAAKSLEAERRLTAALYEVLEEYRKAPAAT